MAITQISAFLENRPGTLFKAISAVTDAGVNMRALSVAETKDFGILRVIVSDVEKTKAALGADTMIRETQVIAVTMDDKTGALKGILEILRNANVNIEYVYAFTGAIQGSAYVVFRVDDVESAEKILAKNGIMTLNDADLEGFLA